MTVADDLLKNDGQKFLEMMESLADKRIQREREAAEGILDDEDEDDDDEDEEDEDDDGQEYDDDEEEDDEEDDVSTVRCISISHSQTLINLPATGGGR